MRIKQKSLRHSGGVLFLTLVCIISLHNDVARAEEPEKPVSEPEAAPGCPIPDLRYSRPRKFDAGTSTEQPGVAVDGTQVPSKDGSTDHPDVANSNGVLSEFTSDREVVRHSRYIDFDPYAWDDAKKRDHNGNVNSPSHTEHTIHRRRIRSRTRQLKSASSIDTNDSMQSHHISSDQTHRQANDITNSFAIGTNLSHNDTQEIETGSTAYAPHNDTSGRRVKRKSGKTTGALSRPKGASDSGSKSTSRKKDGATLDEEGQYIVHAVEETEDSNEEEEEEDVVEHDLFAEVTEVRFPAEVGNGGERKLCRIRCVQGKWVGPICATKEEDV